MINDKYILEVDNIKKYYHIKSKGLFSKNKVVKAVDGISFKLKKGKTISIVGESGCGKSSLGRVLTMIERQTDGKIIYDGKDISIDNSRDTVKLRRQKIQIIFQNPYSSLNLRKKVGSTLEEPLILNTKLNAKERKEKVLSIMSRVGLRPEFYDRYPHMFSGGQRQRIAIARGLMLNPDILVADEPVSALDVSVRAQVLNLMVELQESLGLSYIFISHDLSVVEYISHEVMVMYLGKCVEYAKVETLFDNPRHPYTISLLAATPKLNRSSKNSTEIFILQGELPSPLNPPSGCAFHTRCTRATDICRTNVPELKKYSSDALIACHNLNEDSVE